VLDEGDQVARQDLVRDRTVDVIGTRPSRLRGSAPAHVVAGYYDRGRLRFQAIVVFMAMQSGLPVGVAAFVGRERERAKVVELVADARVVTLTGTGGCGKTRLAVEVARDVVSQFHDGACFLDLTEAKAID
jgi:hypothetical protein